MKYLKFILNVTILILLVYLVYLLFLKNKNNFPNHNKENILQKELKLAKKIKINYQYLNSIIIQNNTNTIKIVLQNGDIGVTTNETFMICPYKVFLKLKIKAIMLDDAKAAYYLNRCYREYRVNGEKLFWLVYSVNLKNKEAINQLFRDRYKIDDALDSLRCRLSKDINSTYCKKTNRMFPIAPK